ncbi:MAG: response regulator [Myxococcota bacterium]
MAKALPILLLDPDGLLKKVKLPERWRVHAFQSVDEAGAGLAHLDPELVLTTFAADGLAFCRTVASRDPTLPVIVVTRAPSSADVMRAVRVGVRDVVDLDGTNADGLSRAMEVALAWRKSLQKGVGVEVERLKNEVRNRQRKLDGFEERVQELQMQLDARSALLSQAERELEAQRQIAQAAVRAKSSFLAHISSELRTPVDVIVSCADRLATQVSEPDQAKEAEHIVGSSRSLLALLEDVHDLAQLEGGRVHPLFEPVALAPVLEQVAASVSLAARGGGVSVEVGACAVDEVLSDPRRLYEALAHLAANAVRFSPGGRVELSVRRELGVDTRWVVLGVRDSRTVPAEPEDGTDLGLAVARQIARLLGGRLEGRSEAGQGSVTEMWLPDAVVTSVSQAVGADLTVLVIDDDPVLRTLMQRMLMADGHSVVASGSGMDAVELARQHQPALVFLDVTLPGIDGFEVLGTLKDDPAVSEIPVVMVSAEVDTGRARELGACDTLTKPVDRDSLRRVIGQHARREQPAGLLVVGAELPPCLVPLQKEGKDVRAVPTHLLAGALEHRPGAVVLPDSLLATEIRTALQALAEHAPEVPVLALVSHVSDEERSFIGSRLAGVVSVYADPSARLRRYASAR